MILRQKNLPSARIYNEIDSKCEYEFILLEYEFLCYFSGKSAYVAHTENSRECELSWIAISRTVTPTFSALGGTGSN